MVASLSLSLLLLSVVGSLNLIRFWLSVPSLDAAESHSGPVLRKMSYFFVYDVASEKKTELNGEKGCLSREYGPVVSISMQFTESSKPYSPEVPEKNVLDHRPTRLAK